MTIHKARNGDVEIAYETFGSPDGEPLLLVMGLETQMLLWPDEFCEELVANGFHVARFDNRDSGLSTHFQAEPARNPLRVLFSLRSEPQYRMEDMADDGFAVMDALGWSSAHVVGASLGSAISQMMALRAPERVRTFTSMMAGTGSQLLAVRIGTVMKLARRRYDDTEEAAGERLADVLTTIGGRNQKIDLDWARAVGRESYRRSHDPTAQQRQTSVIRHARDLPKRVRGITAPTLVMHGDDDRLIRLQAARKLAERIPGARLLVLEGVGHAMSPDVRPRIVQEITAHARSVAR